MVLLQCTGGSDNAFNILVTSTTVPAGTDIYQTFATGSLFPDYITSSTATATATTDQKSLPFTLPAGLATSAAAPSLGVQLCTPLSGGAANAGSCYRGATATALTQCTSGRKLRL